VHSTLRRTARRWHRARQRLLDLTLGRPGEATDRPLSVTSIDERPREDRPSPAPVIRMAPQ
jgi:hypothetical protein